MGTAMKHPVTDWVKPSFVFFTSGTLWRSALGVKGFGHAKNISCWKTTEKQFLNYILSDLYLCICSCFRCNHTPSFFSSTNSAILINYLQLSSNTWNPTTSPWMNQLTWLRYLRLALCTRTAACQKWMNDQSFWRIMHKYGKFMISDNNLLHIGTDAG